MKSRFFLSFYMYVFIVLLRQPLGIVQTISIPCVAFEPLFQAGITPYMMESGLEVGVLSWLP